MTQDRSGGKRVNWLLTKHHDEYVREGGGNVVCVDGRSIATGRTMSAIASG